MISLEEAKTNAISSIGPINSNRIYETKDAYIFYPEIKGKDMVAVGACLACVAKADGSTRHLLFIEDETWDILDTMKPIS